MTPKQPDRQPESSGGRRELLHGKVTAEVIAAFFEVYNTMGYGFLEAVYVRALGIEFKLRGLNVQREVLIDVHYKGECVGKYRVDFIVEYCVAVEVKATRWLVQADRDQLLNCLRCSSLEVGLLLHFGPRPKFYRLVSTNNFS